MNASIQNLYDLLGHTVGAAYDADRQLIAVCQIGGRVNFYSFDEEGRINSNFHTVYYGGVSLNPHELDDRAVSALRKFIVEEYEEEEEDNNFTATVLVGIVDSESNLQSFYLCNKHHKAVAETGCSFAREKEMGHDQVVCDVCDNTNELNEIIELAKEQKRRQASKSNPRVATRWVRYEDNKSGRVNRYVCDYHYEQLKKDGYYFLRNESVSPLSDCNLCDNTNS